ncbi:MAG: vWA domain-containing protein [Arenibacterium sp.]
MHIAVKSTMVWVALALLLSWPTSEGVAQQRPLLVEGKQTVYQRVLTRPGAQRHTAVTAPADGTYAAFQPLYVYAAEPGWYQVGPSISAGPEAWVQAGAVIQWKQNIVAAFTNSSGRERQVLFESEEKLRWLMEHEALRAMQAEILRGVDNGAVPAEMGVVAPEPEAFVNIVQQLYLMPILDFAQDLHPLNYDANLLMKVASVPLREEGQMASTTEEFDAGIVFVFYTTQSMEPFIARSQAALQEVVRNMQGTEVGDRVQFGVVAFRDNPEGAGDVEYRTRTLLPLQRRNDQSQVLATIGAATNVARAPTPGFNEDSLAGVEDAIDLTDWNGGGADPFDARIVILVTDAGPKDPRDPNARSNIGAAELQRAAQDAGIVIMTMHLKTPAGGAAQHSYAEGAYRTLSRFHDDTYYYGIENGSPEAFQSTVETVVTALTDVIRLVRDEPRLVPEDEAGQNLVNLGRAIQLAYLGRQAGTQAPDVIEGWVSERAVENPNKLAIEPRLLVTKNEMATMAELLDELLRLGEQARSAEDASSFFVQVRDVVSRMAQNPDRLVNSDADTLGGALEFLEDLPYESQLMLTTEERWQQSAMNRFQILDGMRQKLTQYRKWLLDPTVWTPLYDDAPDGEYVFAMPFDVLP